MNVKDPTKPPTDFEKMMLDRLGREQAIRNNFMPSMFYALACEQALLAVKAGYDTRESRMKRVGHRIRAAVTAYAWAMKKAVGEGYAQYLALLEDFGGKTVTEQFLSALKAREDCSNTASCPNPEVGSHAVMADALMRRAEEMDDEASQMVSIAIGFQVHRGLTPEEKELRAAVGALLKLGYSAQLSPIGKMWLRHIEIKSRAICEQYIKEESITGVKQ